MPIFVYRCDKGHEFEELQTIHEAPLETCREPGCDALVQKVICAPNFTFKGGAPTPRFYKRG